jgi:SAM-dependent methyltransferase
MKSAIFITGGPQSNSSEFARRIAQGCKFAGRVKLDRYLYKCCDIGLQEHMLLYAEANKFHKLGKRIDVWRIQEMQLRNFLETRPFGLVILDGYQFMFDNFASFYMSIMKEYGFTDFKAHVVGDIPLQEEHHCLLPLLVDSPSELIPYPDISGARHQEYWFVKEPESQSRLKLESLQLPNMIGMSVLDVGCNAGFFSFESARLGAREVVGIDKDERAITGARQVKDLLMPDAAIRFVLESFENLSVREWGEFDFVICASVLHFSNSWPDMLQRLKLMTRKMLVLEVPLYDSQLPSQYTTIDGNEWMMSKDGLLSLLNGMFGRVIEKGFSPKPQPHPHWTKQQVAIFNKTKRCVFHCFQPDKPKRQRRVLAV